MEYSDFKNLREAFDYVKSHGVIFANHTHDHRRVEYVAYVGCSLDIVNGGDGAASFILFRNGKFVKHSVMKMRGMNPEQLAVIAAVGVINEIPNRRMVKIISNNDAVMRLKMDKTMKGKDYDNAKKMFDMSKEDRKIILERVCSKNLGLKVAAMMSFAERIDVNWENLDKRYWV